MEFSFILYFILLGRLQDNAFLLSLPSTQILLQVTTESYSQLITVQLTSTKQYTRNTLRVKLTLTTSNKLSGPKVWNVRLLRDLTLRPIGSEPVSVSCPLGQTPWGCCGI